GAWFPERGAAFAGAAASGAVAAPGASAPSSQANRLGMTAAMSAAWTPRWTRFIFSPPRLGVERSEREHRSRRRGSLGADGVGRGAAHALAHDVDSHLSRVLQRFVGGKRFLEAVHHLTVQPLENIPRAQSNESARSVGTDLHQPKARHLSLLEYRGAPRTGEK